MRCGLVLTPLNYRYTVPEINHALEISRARCLSHHCERQPDVDASIVSNVCDIGMITANDAGFMCELIQVLRTVSRITASLDTGHHLIH